MVEVRKLSHNPPSEAWARSLRQETALQDQYRRAIYDRESGVSSVGLNRWTAAQCLQDQVDSARGVEHTKCLAKSRAIIARFARRSTMKDMQGADLPAVLDKSDIRGSSPGSRVAEKDANLTREQVLKMFDIDLGRVGVMMSARTTPPQPFAPCDDGCSTRNTGKSGRGAVINSNAKYSDAIGRGTAEKDGRGPTIPTRNDTAATEVAAKRQKFLSEKLKHLDTLLSDELPFPPCTENVERDANEGKTRANKDMDDPANVAREKDGSEHKPPAESVACLSGGAGETSQPGKVNSLVKDVPSNEGPATNDERGCGEIFEAEPLQGGHGENETNAATLIDAVHHKHHEKSRFEDIFSTEQRHIYNKALPNHRPCWWWGYLLPPEVKGICIPDTVFSASMPLSSGQDGSHTATAVATGVETADKREHINPTRHNEGSSNGRPSQQRLLWAFSKAEVITDDGIREHHSTEAGLSGGGVKSEKDNGGGGTPAVLSASAKRRGKGGKYVFADVSNPQIQRLPVQHRLYTKTINTREDLLSIAKAICECGRRGGGTGSSGGGSGATVSTPKLPLALLKVWGYQSDEEGRRNCQPSDADGKLGTSCGGRQVRVVSLWTETEVLEALRDMSGGNLCRPNRPRYFRPNVCATKKNSSASTGELLPNSASRTTPPGTSSVSLSAVTGTSQPSSSVPAASCCDTIAANRREQPSRSFQSSVSDGDACCVQAFTKSASFIAVTDPQPRLSPSSAETVSLRVCSPGGTGRARAGATRGGRGSSKGHSRPHGDVDLAAMRDGHEDSRDRRGKVPRTAAGDDGLAGPVFYRVAWGRTGEKRVVWKIRSRYPFVSNLSAHYCPLSRAGSVAPFTATEAEEEAAALVAAKTGTLAEVLRRAYDPTLQRLWADWVVNEEDGQWFLLEVHGVKTDADVRHAAETRALLPTFAEVESKVRSSIHRIPPKHFCGDPNDLRARISAANPTDNLPLVEVSKRAAAMSPRRQRIKPFKVSESTRNALQAQKEHELRREKGGTKGGSGVKSRRRMLHQYWRCAGDFCEIHSGGERRVAASADNCSTNTLSRAELRRSEGAGVSSSEASGSGRGSGGGPEEDEIVGRRKHALAVETPRTVLFRLVLNARAALLRWRPSASDFSNMEKPVQLCSACYVVCNTLERERTEITRRAMDAEDQAARACKARRNRRPPGWKSRLQHELEDSLNAERDVVSCLVDSFENATATAAAATEANKERSPSISPSKTCGGIFGGVRGDAQGISSQEFGVTWADKYPVAEARADRGGRARSGPLQVVGMGVPDDAQATQRGRKTSTGVDGAAGGASPAEPSRLIETVLLPSESSLPIKKQGRVTQAQAFVGSDAKQTPEEEETRQRRERGRKKRDVRARRKAKERARRLLYHAAAEDVADAGNKSSRNGDHNRSLSEAKEGKADSLGHRETWHPNDFPSILKPTAPGEAKHAGGTHTERVERSDSASNGKKGKTASSEGGGPSLCNRAVSVESPAFTRGTEATRWTSGGQQGEVGLDIARALAPALGPSSACHQQPRKEERPGLVLRPTAPTQTSGEEEYRVYDTLGRQGHDEEVGSSIATVKDLANSEYGEEDFEIE